MTMLPEFLIGRVDNEGLTTMDIDDAHEAMSLNTTLTFRPGTGVSVLDLRHLALSDKLQPVGRSMAVAKRTGPDFLFLANAHSQKFDDLAENKVIALSFQNSSNQDWISITGEVVKTTNEDPRIEEVYNKSVAAWFGDLGDGVHTGKPDDPRMTLIEVHAKCKWYLPKA